MQFIYFIVLIGVLIFIHEFGHYAWAKIFGVRVERFAMGMGPVLKSFHVGETEYALCAFPIGGYVKLFGMQPEELYDTEGRRMPDIYANRAFVRKPIWQRGIIMLAGPAMNLIFPVFVYFFFGLMTSMLPPAQVGQVMPFSAAAEAVPITKGAAAGLQAGDRIIRIDGGEISYWTDLTSIVRDSIDVPLHFTVLRGGRELEYTVKPKAHTETDRLGLMRDTFGLIGVTPESFGPILGIPDENSAAFKAGLRSFDHVVAVDGAKVKRYVDFQDLVRGSEGKALNIIVSRPEDAGGLPGLKLGQPMSFTVVPERGPDGYSVGALSADLFLATIEKESPAALAGLRVGDQLLEVDGHPYNKSRLLQLDIQQRIWEEMHKHPEAEPETIAVPLKLKVRRGSEEIEVAYQPKVRKIIGKLKEPVPEIWFGFDTYKLYEFPDLVPVPAGDRIVLALKAGPTMTWRFSKMMANGILHLFEGRVSTDTVGGPIMIFDIAARAGKAGWEPFLRMMAIISINLGLVNLLPIPVLDGGQLMLLTIEAIKRKELSPRTRQVAYYIGLGMIVLLMVLAFKNDIERYWGDFAAWFNG